MLLLCLLAPMTASAKPEYRDAYFQGYRDNGYAVADYMLTVPSMVGDTGAKDCLLCHWNPNGGGPRNPHGTAAKDAIQGIDPSDAAALAAALWGFRTEDPDGDGHSNFVELTDHLTPVAYTNTPTYPGLTAANVGSVKVNGLTQADIDFIHAKLTPAAGAPDTTPPTVVVTYPNGGESITGNVETAIQWTVSDADSGVAGLDVYLSLDAGATYKPVAYLNGPQAMTGSLNWVPPNRPSTQAAIRLYAIDNAGNNADDLSDAVFTIYSPTGGIVATTLRDFDLPGTQPLENRIQPLQDPQTCSACHGGYDSAVEPYHNWMGSMMAHASLDPIFRANMVIANQDAPESGDLCLRCHLSRGWLDGRSSPTDGSRMTDADRIGVSCDLCHRMVDPQYVEGDSPSEDDDILDELGAVPGHFSNGQFVVDPSGSRRGPFVDAASAHPILISPFHRESALCGTCHDVSNPAFVKSTGPAYAVHPLDKAVTNTSSTYLMPVERTYSEWFYSEYNTSNGVYAPEFAGNKTNGYVSTCQDCHMRDVLGKGGNPALFPGVPERPDMPLHDMTGGSTWIPAVMATIYTNEMNQAAVQDGIARATNMLRNAAAVYAMQIGTQLQVRVENHTGHKLPTGYPEGRRIWVNVRFYNEAMQPIVEYGAYDTNTAELATGPNTKVYHVEPGIGTNIAPAVGLPPGPSLHFVLNNMIYSDNRIPPRGFVNTNFEAFGGAPVSYSYADGQYWDDTYYDIPDGASRAEVKLYYQSFSKEFAEFLRDENHTDSQGDDLYALWEANGRCPPFEMAALMWSGEFPITAIERTALATIRVHFSSSPDTTYTIQYKDDLKSAQDWQTFAANGSFTASSTNSFFEDDFTAATSGSEPAGSARFYRVVHE